MPKNATKRKPNFVEMAVALAGGSRAVGELFTPKVSRQAVDKWVKAGVIPARRVKVVSDATGIARDRLNEVFREEF